MVMLRRLISVAFFAFLTLTCARCGSAYPYQPVSGALDSNSVGAATPPGATGAGTTTGTTPVSGGGSTTGTSTGTTAGGGNTTGTSTGTTAGGGSMGTANPNSIGGTTTGTTAGSPAPTGATFTLTVQGQGFFQDGGDPVSAALLTADGNKTGATATSNVSQNGQFLLTIANALDANTAYNVAVFISSAGDTHCNWQDEQWMESIPAGDANVTVQITPQRATGNFCSSF